MDDMPFNKADTPKSQLTNLSGVESSPPPPPNTHTPQKIKNKRTCLVSILGSEFMIKKVMVCLGVLDQGICKRDESLIPFLLIFSPHLQRKVLSGSHVLFFFLHSFLSTSKWEKSTFSPPLLSSYFLSSCFLFNQKGSSRRLITFKVDHKSNRVIENFNKHQILIPGKYN